VSAAADEEKRGLGFGFVPFLIYNSDWGVGGGAKGAVYWHQPGSKPYALKVDGQFFITSRLVQYHYVGIDVPRVFGTPLRVDGSLWYTASITENYCGLGMAASCDTEVSLARAGTFLEQHGLKGTGKKYLEAQDELSRKFYQYRQVAPYGVVNLRYAVMPWLQVFGGYKFQYYMIRPYPLSQVAEDMPLGSRQGGASSLPQLGMVVDTRDFEPAPTLGTFSEASVRLSSKALFSGYDWMGVNLTLRGWAPLTPGGAVVFAIRIIADAMFGNVPFYEQSSVGGSDQLNGLGGERTVRGIRNSRFRGKGKLLLTPELRVTWTRFKLPLWKLGTPELDIGNVFFLDVGKVVAEWPKPSLNAGRMEWAWPEEQRRYDAVMGTGVGLRIGINRVFILKGDVAVSPQEPGGPGIYMNVGHIF
jgi:hypothetical protein